MTMKVMRYAIVAAVFGCAIVGGQSLAAVTGSLVPGVLDPETPNDFAAYYNILDAASIDNADGSTTGKSGFGRSMRGGATGPEGFGRHFGQSFANLEAGTVGSVAFQVRLGTSQVTEAPASGSYTYRFRLWEHNTVPADATAAIALARSYPSSHTNPDGGPLPSQTILAQFDYSFTQAEADAAIEAEIVDVLRDQPGGDGGVHESFKAALMKFDFSGAPITLQANRAYFVSVVGTHTDGARPFDIWAKNNSLNTLFLNGNAYESSNGSSSGQFGTDGTRPSYGFAVKYGAASQLPGDFNSDGQVDTADYTTWRDGLGTEFDQIDYDVWAENFGAVAAASSVSTVSTSVPEPSGLVTILAAALLASTTARKSRAIAPH
jgi:hypothetical protein